MAKKAKKQTKYEWMSDLLGRYGLDVITHEQFWGQMKRMGYGQDDIDKWCAAYHERQEQAAAAAMAQRRADFQSGRDRE